MIFDLYQHYITLICSTHNHIKVLARRSQKRGKLKTQAINRKQFLQGKLKGEQAIRPPWSIGEAHFTETCTRCFKCAEACPSQLIVKGSSGFPEMSFLRQGCDYCEACVQSCPENALLLTQDNQQSPWQQHIVINEQCFASRGIVCRSCGEVCEADAIEFKLLVGGNSQININESVCDGCGECVHVCPAHAIEVQKINLESRSGMNPVGRIPVSENPGGDNL
ncbi:MAG: ferredoxin-type protein NapF [endosymbiont of Galathealinum brachiosum]|uniref:Ferredoxin-type protein NapF n=1 Tax=endosymbiont of Galathealinum brachiosum TaxID=2200906 RepID=A0A370D868_9GAMM|nr:MAG: ferredoxin-type protein NapF [endosymbiont of Galathealinum brachiosum]